jgi:predicted nuclease with TOPRIM domain
LKDIEVIIIDQSGQDQGAFEGKLTFNELQSEENSQVDRVAALENENQRLATIVESLTARLSRFEESKNKILSDQKAEFDAEINVLNEKIVSLQQLNTNDHVGINNFDKNIKRFHMIFPGFPNYRWGFSKTNSRAIYEEPIRIKYRRN